MADDNKLVQVRFSEPMMERIKELQNISGNETMKQLFMDALATYETLKGAQTKGDAVIIEHKDGKRERVIVP